MCVCVSYLVYLVVSVYLPVCVCIVFLVASSRLWEGLILFPLGVFGGSFGRRGPSSFPSAQAQYIVAHTVVITFIYFQIVQ